MSGIRLLNARTIIRCPLLKADHGICDSNYTHVNTKRQIKASDGETSVVEVLILVTHFRARSGFGGRQPLSVSSSHKIFSVIISDLLHNFVQLHRCRHRDRVDGHGFLWLLYLDRKLFGPLRGLIHYKVNRTYTCLQIVWYLHIFRFIPTKNCNCDQHSTLKKNLCKVLTVNDTNLLNGYNSYRSFHNACSYWS